VDKKIEEAKNDGLQMKQDAYHSRYRWIMLLLLWLLYIAFGLVARSITPLVTPILNDLRMSYSQMGFILGSWQLTYILVALVAGAILDRWGVQKSIFAGALIIGLSASIRFYATGFLTMLIAIVLFGVGGPMISINNGNFSGSNRNLYGRNDIFGYSLYCDCNHDLFY